jgi:dihydrofolate reductase
MTLDGYVAGPKGESDWIVMDPEIDFAALASSFDTLLLGRKTYEAAAGWRPSNARDASVCPIEHIETVRLPGRNGVRQRQRHRDEAESWLLPDPADRAKLKLTKHRVYTKTGTVALEYDVA